MATSGHEVCQALGLVKSLQASHAFGDFRAEEGLGFPPLELWAGQQVRVEFQKEGALSPAEEEAGRVRALVTSQCSPPRCPKH